MSCELVLAPSFPILLERLLAEIRRACKASPLAPKWVVVPSSTLANSLRVTLGQGTEDGVLAGVRVIPLPAFVRRFSDGAGAIPSERWGPQLDLLLLELVEKLPPDSPLSPLQELPSGYRLLRPTFLDLGDGGFGLHQLEILEELAREPDLAPLERGTLQLYSHWIRLVGQRRLGWEPLSHQQIPEWIETADEPSLFRCLSWEGERPPIVMTYGFYGFTDVNAQVVTALGRRMNLKILYPSPPDKHPAFSFAVPILQDLKARLGTSLEQVSRPPQLPPFQPCLDFFQQTFPEGEVTIQPKFLTFQRASGVRAELVSAALRVRRWLDDDRDSIRPEQIMVVAPDPSPYTPAVAEIFAEFAIPIALIDIPAGPTPESRILQTLVRMWEERGGAEWVLAYLREHPGLPVASQVDVTAFEKKVRSWGVWGDSSWGVILTSAQAGVEGGRAQLPSFTREERDLVSIILEDWGSQAISHSPLTPSDAMEFLDRIRRRWLPQPDLLDPFYRGLENVRSSQPQLRMGPPLLREMLLQSIPPQMTTERMDRQAVRFVPLMRARGLTSRGMVVLGLASGNWPLQIEEDPILSDASRGRLAAKAGQLGHLLPIKSRATQEMSMLFFLLNTSSEAVHWVIPESDSTGRSVASTPWVQHYLQRWETATEAEIPWPRVPPSPIEQGEILKAIDPERGTYLPPGWLAFTRPELRKHLPSDLPYSYLDDARKQREVQPEWNGHIPAAALPAHGSEEDRVSVTQLEDLARCPYRFYARCLMDWSPLEPLVLSDQLTPLKWGSLLHALLESLFQPLLGRDHRAVEIAERLLCLTDSQLRDHLLQLPTHHHLAIQILPEVFAQATLDRLFETVRSYAHQLVLWTSGKGVPIHLELKKRVPFPGLEGLLISGQMDRVDQHSDGLHIHDYKSGTAPMGRIPMDREASLGYRIQPLLYPWILAAEHPDSKKTDFSFVFLGSDPPCEKSPTARGEAEEMLGPLGEILRNGLFLPIPTTTLEMLNIEQARSCQFCSLSSLCRRFDPGAHHRYGQLARQHLSLRLGSLQDVGRSGKRMTP